MLTFLFGNLAGSMAQKALSQGVTCPLCVDGLRVISKTAKKNRYIGFFGP